MLFDTHNHFDDPIFNNNRYILVQQLATLAIKQMVITGITVKTFEQMLEIQKQINQFALLENLDLTTHLAFGLHPFFIHEHQLSDIELLAYYISQHKAIAIGEVGLDTFTPEMKTTQNFAKQQLFFNEQLDLAVQNELPILLHIRKAHAESIKIIKQHHYNAHELGGIAHTFSGGVQEAKAFVKMGFKLGISGQICNPNAKKLRKAIVQTVAEYGLDCLVVETDCPDMTPLPARLISNNQSNTINIPANLIYVIESLSSLLKVDRNRLSSILWKNSLNALRLS